VVSEPFEQAIELFVERREGELVVDNRNCAFDRELPNQLVQFGMVGLRVAKERPSFSACSVTRSANDFEVVGVVRRAAVFERDDVVGDEVPVAAAASARVGGTDGSARRRASFHRFVL